MKILYHHRTLSKDGQDVHIQEMIAALSRKGHEVILVAPSAARRRKDANGDVSSRLRALLPRSIAELLELGYSIPAYVRLLRAWKAHRPDFLYERYNLLLMSGVWLKRRTGIPMMLEVNAPLYEERRLHGGLAWPRLARWIERHVWRYSDAVLPVTAVLATHMKTARISKDRIHVIPNGVDLRRFASIDGSAIRRELGVNDKVVLGFTGFIRAWHGLTQVIDVMAALRGHCDLHLLVIGDGPGRPALEERATALGMIDHLTILGVVERDRVGAYIAAFDIALQPEVVAYASPLKLFEYMALGRAIIAPDQPNIREVLAHEKDAILFDPTDRNGFAAAIERLSADHDLRAKLGEEARNRIDTGRYSWDCNATRIEEIARGLLDSASKNKSNGIHAEFSAAER